MRYQLALSDADNTGQLGTNVTIEIPFWISSGSIADGEHNWYVGPYNEILALGSGQVSTLGYSDNSGGIDIGMYVRWKGTWVSGAKIYALFDSLGLKNSSGTAAVHKNWHKKGITDG